MYLNETFGIESGGSGKCADCGLDSLTLESCRQHFIHWSGKKPIVVHAEGDMLAMIIALMALYKKPVHVAHISTTTEVELVKRAKELGYPITCEICPHHLFMSQETWNSALPFSGRSDSPGYRKVKPSLLKTEEERKKLWDYIDVFDVIATDHAPHAAHESDCYGYPGVETVLSLALEIVNRGYMTLDDLIAKMHTNPLRIFGIEVPDLATNYVEVNLNKNWVVKGNQLFSKSKWSPYEGWNLPGKVIRVVMNGKTKYLDGKFLHSKAGEAITHYSREPINTLGEIYAPTLECNMAIKDPIVMEESENIVKVKLSEKINKKIKNIPTTWTHTHITTAGQFTRQDLRYLFSIASEIRSETSSIVTPNKQIALYFEENSSRTKNSFISAIQRLGGNAINFESATSSEKKGETSIDTLKCLAAYSDALVIRSSQIDLIEKAKKEINIPIINGGNGEEEHPTQALTDVFTIREEKGSLHGLTITLVGDLKYGRTIHSLLQLLTLYSVRVILVSSLELQLPEYWKKKLTSAGLNMKEYSYLSPEVIKNSDVIYLTRIQKERFPPSLSLPDYHTYLRNIQLTPKKLSNAKKDVIIMHPLPRNEELPVEIDVDPRAVYFRQMKYGMYIRMALLSLLFQ